MQVAHGIDKNCLSRRHVTEKLKSQYIEGDALRCHHVFGLIAGVLALSNHQWTNTIRVPESHQTHFRDHSHRRIAAFTASVQGADRCKNIYCLRYELAETLQLMGKHVEQHFGVRIRIEMAKIAFKEPRTESFGIG